MFVSQIKKKRRIERCSLYLESNRGDGGDDGRLGVASTSSAVEESDEAVAISREASPRGCGVLSSSDEVEGEDLLSATASDLESAGWVLREGDGDGADGPRVLVVDGVLDGVTSVETEVVGDDSADRGDSVAGAGGVLSGGSSRASSTALAGEVGWDATSEVSEPWEVDVTSGRETA